MKHDLVLGNGEVSKKFVISHLGHFNEYIFRTFAIFPFLSFPSSLFCSSFSRCSLSMTRLIPPATRSNSATLFPPDLPTTGGADPGLAFLRTSLWSWRSDTLVLSRGTSSFRCSNWRFRDRARCSASINFFSCTRDAWEKSRLNLSELHE